MGGCVAECGTTTRLRTRSLQLLPAGSGNGSAPLPGAALFASQGSAFGCGGSWDSAQSSRGDDGGYGGGGKGGKGGRVDWMSPNSRPGDWQCLQCGDHQFSRNTTCRQCGANRPGELDLLLQDVNVPPHLQALISQHQKEVQERHEEKEQEQARRKGKGKGKWKDWD